MPEIHQKMNRPRFSFELALFHFELTLPSLNWPFRNDTFSSQFLTTIDNDIILFTIRMLRMFLVAIATYGNHELAGIEFKDFNLGFRLCTFLCTTLNCIEFFHKIWDSVHLGFWLKAAPPINTCQIHHSHKSA